MPIAVMAPEILGVVLFGGVLAAFVCGLSGFAFGMVSLSVWVWVLEPDLLAPLVIYGSLVAQLSSFGAAWRGMRWNRLWPMLLGGVIGVPIGAAALAAADPADFRLAVGAVMVGYSGFMLLVRRPPRIPLWGGRRADAAAGLLGGTMGGFAGLPAPAPTIWLVLRGWEKDGLRATLQVFNLAMHVVTTAAYLATGTIRREHAGLFLALLPVLLIGAVVGARLYHRLDDAAFRRIVLGLLFVLGFAMLGSAALG